STEMVGSTVVPASSCARAAWATSTQAVETRSDAIRLRPLDIQNLRRRKNKDDKLTQLYSETHACQWRALPAKVAKQPRESGNLNGGCGRACDEPQRGPKTRKPRFARLF